MKRLHAYLNRPASIYDVMFTLLVIALLCVICGCELAEITRRVHSIEREWTTERGDNFKSQSNTGLTADTKGN